MKKRTDKLQILSANIIAIAYHAEKDTDILDKYFAENSIDIMDKERRTLIFYAILASNIFLVKYLLEKGANISIADKVGWYPLHYAAQNYLGEICLLLIQKGANIDAQDSYGNTALGRATFASEGRGEIIKLLLLHGSNPKLPNNHGISPISLANTIANYNVKQFFN